MHHSSAYQQKRDEILKLIKDATPKQPDPPPQPPDCDDCGRLLKILSILVITCLLGTMIPVDQVNAAFSLSALAGIVAILILGRGRKTGSLSRYNGTGGTFCCRLAPLRLQR
jgi:hypothetical protein